MKRLLAKSFDWVDMPNYLSDTLTGQSVKLE